MACAGGEAMIVKVLYKNSGKRYREPFEYAPGFIFDSDPSCSRYDWLVVYDEMPHGTLGTVKRGCETLRCPRENTILLTWEPVSVKVYSRAYTRQFAHLLTNRPREAERHPGYFLGRGYYKWFNNRSYEENSAFVVPEKTRLFSAVCSAKQMKHTQHFNRYRLISHLAKAFPELDWYGHGVKRLGKKYEALDSYKYHVAVENHIGAGHWSEKIADALLCGCLPFYAGDPELGKTLPPESFIPIPIDDPAEAEAIIRRAIAEGEYEKRREAIDEARKLLLSKYNFWAQVIACIEASASSSRSMPGGKIYSRKTVRLRSPGAVLEEGWFRFKQMMHL